MQQDHVPSIGVRMWTVVMIASVFGSTVGDFLSAHLALGFMIRLLLLAAVVGLIFAGEARDRSKSQAWYWMAVVTIQAAATKLSDFLTIDLGLGRLQIIVGISMLLVVMAVIVRSGEKFVISQHMVARPGAMAKPMTDATHWIGMVVSSIVGSVASEFMAIGLGAGPVGAAAILAMLLAASFWLHRRPGIDLLMVFWVTGALIRATSTTFGDLLAKTVGLSLGALLTGSLLIALLVLWRQPRSHA